MRAKAWRQILLAALPGTLLSVTGTRAQEGKTPSFYTLINLGTLGGTHGVAEGINNVGWIGGTADLTDNAAEAATLWLPGVTVQIPTLGGPNSSMLFAPNQVETATGSAETATTDPLGEDFCSYGTHLECEGFIWHSNSITALPNLGGNNGFGIDINDSGQVVGLSETTLNDATCEAPQVLQSLPAIWVNGVVHALPVPHGDGDGQAVSNNDLGEVAGFSGNCKSNTMAHALIWIGGRVIKLPTLGGEMNNAGQKVNRFGDVAGFSDLPGEVGPHAVLWRNGFAHDLGTLPGDALSYAIGVNDFDQVVGQSCDADNNCSAFLWQDGEMWNLNGLVASESGLYMTEADDINNLGEIVGSMTQFSNGNTPAYLAVPIPNSALGGSPSPEVKPTVTPKVSVAQTAGKPTAHLRGRF